MGKVNKVAGERRANRKKARSPSTVVILPESIRKDIQKVKSKKNIHSPSDESAGNKSPKEPPKKKPRFAHCSPHVPTLQVCTKETGGFNNHLHHLHNG